jgi:AraC family transcriptional regulator
MDQAVSRNSVLVGGFLVQKTTYPANLHTKPLRHSFPYLCYVESGGYSETTQAGCYRRTPLTVHFHAANELQNGVIGKEGAQCLSVVALPDRLQTIGTNCDWSQLRTDSQLKTLTRILNRISGSFSKLDSRKRLRMEVDCIELCTKLAESPIRFLEPGWVAQICNFIEANADARITLAELSQIAGVHRVQIVRGLKRWRGWTPGEFKRQAQLSHAKTMLLTTSQSVGYIAAAAGFADQSHFARTFKKFTGQSVSEFRTKGTEENPSC